MKAGESLPDQRAGWPVSRPGSTVPRTQIAAMERREALRCRCSGVAAWMRAAPEDQGAPRGAPFPSRSRGRTTGSTRSVSLAGRKKRGCLNLLDQNLMRGLDTPSASFPRTREPIAVPAVFLDGASMLVERPRVFIGVRGYGSPRPRGRQLRVPHTNLGKLAIVGARRIFNRAPGRSSWPRVK